MATRSLNKAVIIGNLTRDPELRYTPSGTPVCSFGVATNRSWLPSGSDERREETEFHSVVAWSKLAELCAQLLSKGRKVYIEGRLQTRSWETQAGEKRTKTEIVAEDMIILDSRHKKRNLSQDQSVNSNVSQGEEKGSSEEKKEEKKNDKIEEKAEKVVEEKKEIKDEKQKEDIDLDKIPF